MQILHKVKNQISSFLLVNRHFISMDPGKRTKETTSGSIAESGKIGGKFERSQNA